MRVYILGICGTSMACYAILARQKGYEVAGCDENVYPPMSTQLEDQKITLHQGYNKKDLIDFKPDVIIVGNVIKRGNPVLEYILNEGLAYLSGPQWLSQEILQGRWVLAVAGTHGKTTTSAMLTWVMSQAGVKPGYLIGGIPKNFETSAELGDGKFFVIESDEYDTVFSDKRSKFLHHRPKTLILNNLEYDHADIFPDLAAIQTQFHHLVRTIPSEGLIIYPTNCSNIQEVLDKGLWTKTETFSDDANTKPTWSSKLLKDDGSHFEVYYQGELKGEVNWHMLGNHNVQNALATLAASHHAGVEIKTAINALCKFEGVKRRLEVIANINNIKVYDDFAHHPTAIESTLSGLRANVGNEKITVVLQFGSYTMRNGVHGEKVFEALTQADQCLFLDVAKDSDWHVQQYLPNKNSAVFNNVDDIVGKISKEAKPHEHILIMSNTGFDGIYTKLISALGE